MKKKLYWQTTFGKIEIEETVIKVANERLRPFSSSAQVKCRSYSYYLQRAIVDFGADVSFQERSEETFGALPIRAALEFNTSYSRKSCKNVFDFIEKENPKKGTAQQVVAEMDGSMIPVVDTAIPEEGKADRRRGRTLRWQEARLCFARSAKLITPIFYATMGNIERAGNLLYKAALRVNWTKDTSSWFRRWCEMDRGANDTHIR